MGDWFQTYSGKKFDYSDVEAYTPTVEEVAHSLSNTCRYNGHCKGYYSVAEHAARCALLAFRLGLSPAVQFAALHHDDDEAYSGDVIRPLKKMLRVVHHEGYIVSFSTLEARIQQHIRSVFNVTWDDEIARQVCDLDNTMLLVEKEFILGPSPEPWDPIRVPEGWLETGINLVHRWGVSFGSGPRDARELYLERHAWLRGLLELL